MRKRPRKRFDHGEPIAKIDTRPLAFVAMFLAIVFLMPAAQVKPHSFHIDLWNGETAHPLIAGSGERAKEQYPFVNHVTISSDGMLFWNDEFINEWQLHTLLREVQLLSEQGIIEYQPHPTASYDRAVKVLYMLQNSSIPLRIAGMEKHCEFPSGRRKASVENGARGSLNLALTIMTPQRDEDFVPYTQRTLPCEPIEVVHLPR